MKETVKSIIYSALGLALLLSVPPLLRPFGEPSNLTHIKRIEQLVERGDSIETITLGASVSMAIWCRELGDTCHHAWAPYTDLVEMNYRARNLLPNLPRLKTVFISFHFRSLSRDSLANAENGRQARILAYSNFGTIYQPGVFIPADGDYDELILGRLWPLSSPDHLRDVKNRLLSEFYGLTPRRKMYRYTLDEYGIQKNRRFFLRNPDPEGVSSWVAEQFEAVNTIQSKNPQMAEKLEKRLMDTIEMLKARGIRVVLYSPPYLGENLEGLKRRLPGAWKQFYESAARIEEKTGVNYYDTHYTPGISNDYGMFMDMVHLNQQGSRKFTKLLLSRIKEEEGVTLAAAQPRNPGKVLRK